MSLAVNHTATELRTACVVYQLVFTNLMSMNNNPGPIKVLLKRCRLDNESTINNDIKLCVQRALYGNSNTVTCYLLMHTTIM